MRVASLLVLVLVLSVSIVVAGPGKRNPRWATPIKRPGLPNFHRVSPNLYRGAQPTARGMQELKKLGVRTVVNLRSFHSDREDIGETGLGYEHLYVKAWNPEPEEVVRFLQIVADYKRKPVFIHCQHGADRTGLMCAAYRLCIQGWSKEDAIDELKNGGFGYHSIWRNIPPFLRDLDIESIKRRAGVVVTQEVQGELGKLSWMVGHWSSHDGKVAMEELWLEPRGGLMLGLHRDVFGPQKAFFEYLRIEETRDGVVYQASPAGQPPTPYRLEKVENQRAVFVNPDHDFPRRIVYSRTGNELRAQVEGTRGGKPASADWSWTLR